MNLHAIVRPLISVLNPPTIGSILLSTGYTTGANGKQVPSYADPIEDVQFDVQPLAAKEVAHLDSLNIQGVFRSVWVDGIVQGINRPDGKGGDLLLFDSKTWLVVQVFESWDRPGWSHVAAQLQK